MMRKIRLIFVLIISYAITLNAQIVLENLVGRYPLDGNANDMGNLAINGSVNGALLTTDRFNHENSAFQFDGIDDYIVTSTQIDDSLSNGATFAAWIKIDENHSGRIVSNFNGAGAIPNCQGRIGFVFGVAPENQINVFYATSGGDYVGRITDTNEIEIGKWYHVAATWNGKINSSDFNIFLLKTTGVYPVIK